MLTCGESGGQADAGISSGLAQAVVGKHNRGLTRLHCSADGDVAQRAQGEGRAGVASGLGERGCNGGIGILSPTLKDEGVVISHHLARRAGNLQKKPRVKQNEKKQRKLLSECP